MQLRVYYRSSNSVVTSETLKACNRCKIPKPFADFYRKRRQGFKRQDGTFKWRGENARRNICSVCERKAYPPKPYDAAKRKAYYESKKPKKRPPTPYVNEYEPLF